MEVEKLADFNHQFDKLIKKPEKFISIQEDESESIKVFVKNLYDFTKQAEDPKKKNSEALEELFITDLDEEQIWQQIELQNNLMYNTLISDLPHLLAKKDHLKFPIKEKKKKKIVAEVDCEKKALSEVRDKNAGSSKKEKKSKHPVRKPQSVVDDKFFKLHEMEQFLEKIENEKETDENDDLEVDYFQSDLSEEDDDENDNENEKQLHYNDFFDQPDDELDSTTIGDEKTVKNVRFSIPNEENGKSSEDELEEQENSDSGEDNNELGDSDMENSDAEGDDNDRMEDEEGEDEDMEEFYDNMDENDDKDDDEDEEENESITGENSKHPSTFEARQERLKLRIKNLEEEALREKPWQLKGEVTASSRPQNSLLEEYVEFDIATRPAPVLTEKSTLKLEDVIIQRIKDKAWDDVVRKFKPVENDFEYKKKLVLDQEKSKLSLAQIYEQDYLQQLDSKNKNDLDKPEVEPPEHQEIKALMNQLFHKLDALSNFHFTPKQVSPEVKIINNLPAIAMEEVAPVATSDATLLAPEEVKPKSKGDLIGKSERTATDKKRERRQKKLKQKLKFKKLEAMAKAKLEKSDSKGLNKKISEKLLQKITKSKNVTQLEENKDDKYIKSSNAFFSKLQAETSNKIQKKGLALKNTKLVKAKGKKSKAR